MARHITKTPNIKLRGNRNAVKKVHAPTVFEGKTPAQIKIYESHGIWLSERRALEELAQIEKLKKANVFSAFRDIKSEYKLY